jgi:hypothetical protein
MQHSGSSAPPDRSSRAKLGTLNGAEALDDANGDASSPANLEGVAQW